MTILNRQSNVAVQCPSSESFSSDLRLAYSLRDPRAFRRAALRARIRAYAMFKYEASQHMDVSDSQSLKLFGVFR